MQTAQTVYSGAAEVGRLSATIGLIIASVIGGAALIGGIYLVSTEAAPLAEIPNLPGMSTQMTNFKNSAQKAAQEQANRARKMFGYMLIGLGLFIVLVAWIWWYVTRKSKIAAAAGGVSEVFDLLSS